MEELKKKLKNDMADKIWYAFCFVLLGLIDQRRGSALGTTQMIFANLTGLVIAMLLLPSVKREFWKTKYAGIWTLICIPLLVCGYIVGKKVWGYPGQWNTAVLNVALIGYAILYIIWNRDEIKKRRRLHKGFFLLLMGTLFLMQLSPHPSLWSIWFFGMFGSFYLIGIPKEKEDAFISGMLAGIIAWFFLLQTIAFGFRPFDHVRYRSLYSGETQSGLFYMIVFCAFTGMWLLLKKRNAKPFFKILCFLLSAGSVSFQLLTGGRSSLFGIFAAAIVAYMAYDIILCNSFRHWIMPGVALGICSLLLFPVVYGCVRYLPTILHHPIWFEGEYNEETSIHSYDPWNSEKYISFERVLNTDIARLFQIFGITLSVKDGKIYFSLPGDLTAHAAELGEPGNSPDNPFFYGDGDTSDPIGVRRTIYYYYATHLNLWGHKDNGGFYMTDYKHLPDTPPAEWGTENFYKFYYKCAAEMSHAHNMFLQFAYNYGIIVGVLFLALNLWCFLRLLRRKDITGIICAAFLTAILVYGLTEMAVTTGQITLTLLFLIYYFGMQKVSGRED